MTRDEALDLAEEHRISHGDEWTGHEWMDAGDQLECEDCDWSLCYVPDYDWWDES